jgi:hypothetical protein
VAGVVEVVFCMDTEGPCRDPASSELLPTWDQVDHAMDKLLDDGFRARRPDPQGRGLRIGWFFLTWTGFTANPRARAFGYHAVRDHYLERWGEELAAFGDEQHWHYHHPPTSGIGNEWGLDWTAGREYEQILSRQLLDREWFPVGYRAGGTIMDPVSSRWVDCWFPVDYSNRAPLNIEGLVDWSPGVADWALYHPSPEDFRVPGAGRRRMARCLDLETSLHSLSEDDVVAAFERAAAGRPAVLACFDHDYRDIADRVDAWRELVAAVAGRFPHVAWRYAGPLDAVRGYLEAPPQPPLELDAAHHAGAVDIRSSEPLFQAIPWLAVETGSGEVLHLEQGIVRLDATRWRWEPPPELEWERLAAAGSTDLGEAATATISRSDGPGTLFLRRRTGISPERPRSIWHHSKYFVELCVERASGRADEMDAVRQAVDYLSPRLEPGMTVLDVGCAGAHLRRSLHGLGVEYFGIDLSERAIEIGRLYGRDDGLPAGRLRALAVEDLPPAESYDAVVCLSTLAYLPMFHLPLEAMARAARRWLVVRSSFGDATDIRYLPDVLLEEPFQSMRTYLNVFSRGDVQRFLEREGFAVAWEEDRRQRERFGGEPEVVGGIPIPYAFLLAERVAPTPSDEELLGEELARVAADWRQERYGG